MRAVLEKQIMILPGMCDSTARLGIPDAFSLCMDLATEHAEELGCGLNALMPQGKFWLTVKTKLRFYRRPRMTETVTASTWPEKPGSMRCLRDYLVRSDDEILVAGKTQWAIVNTVSSVPPGSSRPSAAAAAPKLMAANRKEYTMPLGIQFL